MKLTEQMKLMLLQTLVDSLCIKGQPFLFKQETRTELYENILKLQDQDIEKIDECIRGDGNCSIHGNSGQYCKYCDGKWG